MTILVCQFHVCLSQRGSISFAFMKTNKIIKNDYCITRSSYYVSHCFTTKMRIVTTLCWEFIKDESQASDKPGCFFGFGRGLEVPEDPKDVTLDSPALFFFKS